MVKWHKSAKVSMNWVGDHWLRTWLFSPNVNRMFLINASEFICLYTYFLNWALQYNMQKIMRTDIILAFESLKI